MNFHKILDFFLPNPCLICQDIDILSDKASVCRNCFKENKQNISYIGLCPVCKGLLENDLCCFCSSKNIFFDSLQFLYYRDDFQKKVINSLKFHSNFYASYYYRINIYKILAAFRHKFDYCTFLPHSKKDRSFNVVKSVVKKISTYFSLPIMDIFLKIFDRKQSSNNSMERYFYAQKSFKIKDNFKNRLKDNYLLVDDVFTTGATVNEVSKILKENGAFSVHVFVFLKTITKKFISL